MAGTKVGVVVGSIRKGSFSRALAKAMCGLNPNLQCEILEIAQLPMYNQDLDGSPPREWVDFKARIKACDAILFVTPEYNRSVPGVLKNAIDVASRPYGQSAWEKKPSMVVSCSPGGIGGFGSNHHLRQCLVFLQMPVMQMEAYVGSVNKLVNEQGQITSDDTRGFLTKIMQDFGSWIGATASKA
jgi:chromate reductase